MDKTIKTTWQIAFGFLLVILESIVVNDIFQLFGDGYCALISIPNFIIRCNYIGFLTLAISVCLSIALVQLFLNTRQKFKEWKDIPKIGNLHLSGGIVDYKNNTCDLIITNNEWRRKQINIVKTEIHHKDKLLLWRQSNYSLGRYKERTMSFLTFKKNQGFYVGDESISNNDGRFDFDVAIVFSPAIFHKGKYYDVKWFDVTVFYKHPHYFNIQIKSSTE